MTIYIYGECVRRRRAVYVRKDKVICKFKDACENKVVIADESICSVKSEAAGSEPLLKRIWGDVLVDPRERDKHYDFGGADELLPTPYRWKGIFDDKDDD